MSDAIQTGRSGLCWSEFVNRMGRLTMGAWLIPPVVLPQWGQSQDPRVLNKRPHTVITAQ